MIKVKSLKAELYDAQDAARRADDCWQAELDKLSVDRYSKAAKGKAGSILRGLYDAKVASDNRQSELTRMIRQYQDVDQIARPTA